LKNGEAENAVAAEIAPNWSVSGTRGFFICQTKFRPLSYAQRSRRGSGRRVAIKTLKS
jgi:hypothetical protein